MRKLGMLTFVIVSCLGFSGCGDDAAAVDTMPFFADERADGGTRDGALDLRNADGGGDDARGQVVRDGSAGAAEAGSGNLSAMDANGVGVDGEVPRPDAAVMPVAMETGRLVGFTEAHNAARARVETTPPLPPLTWSTEIAAVAQAYAEKLAQSCSRTLTHSRIEERNGWGENLAWFGGDGGPVARGSAEGTVMAWESEVRCYTYGAITRSGPLCSAQCERSGCGHYTQVAWRNTRRVGCGVADCASGPGRGSYWVCNYDPAGNIVGQEPY